MHWQNLIRIALISSMLAACGGGGGGSSDGGVATDTTAAQSAGSSTSFASALNFDSPDSFANGRSYTTTRFSITVTGELNSVTIPGGYCPGTPPQNHTVRWTSEATGASDTIPVSIGCVVNNLFGKTSHGVASAFSADNIDLNLGENFILFETFDDGRKVGEDRILIIREDRTPPAISFSHPAPGTIEVPIDHPVMVQFSEAMDEASLTTDRFTVVDADDNPLHGALDYDPTHFTWTLQPDQPFSAGEQYSVTISAETLDAGGANPLQHAVSWSFVAGTTNDHQAPMHDRFWPGSTCDCAPVNSRILVSFDEPLLPASIHIGTLQVRDTFDQPVQGTTRYAGDYLEFLPDSPLSPGMAYTVNGDPGIQDLTTHIAGQSIAWTFVTDDRTPAGHWEEMERNNQAGPMTGHTSVWADPEALFWDGSVGTVFTPATGTWSALSSQGAPVARTDHSAVWTGDEMIVWGGRADGTPIASGARFNPLAADWTAMPAPAQAAYQATYGHIAMWTGSEMIIWGGMTSDDPDMVAVTDRGWRYDPVSDDWQAMTTTDAPAARHNAQAVWSGSQLLIWGGTDPEGNYLDSGARYDPATDTWLPITSINAPVSHGYAPRAAWTGTEMIVWNGGALDAEQRSNAGMREPTLHLYDPATDTWRTSNSGWEPLLFTRSLDGDVPQSANLHWIGDRLIAVGGWTFAGIWSYNPSTDAWQELNREGGRFGYRGAAEIWAGDRLINWGGVMSAFPTDTGKVFIP